MPVSHTLGKIGAGMAVILSNFNHERWMVTATSIGAQRLVVEECLKYKFFLTIILVFNFAFRWTTQRIVFSKPLTSQAVIRAKLASMIARIETCQNWFEFVTYQMNNVGQSRWLLPESSLLV